MGKKIRLKMIFTVSSAFLTLQLAKSLSYVIIHSHSSSYTLLLSHFENLLIRIRLKYVRHFLHNVNTNPICRVSCILSFCFIQVFLRHHVVDESLAWTRVDGRIKYGKINMFNRTLFNRAPRFRVKQ